MSESIPQRKIYCRFRKGWFIRDAMPGDDLSENPQRNPDGSLPPKIITRTREDGSKIDEAHFRSLSGYVHDMYISTREYKGSINHYVNIQILSDDDGQTRLLQLSVFSDAGQGLLNRIENVDYTRSIDIRAGYNLEKESGFIWIKQMSMNVPQRYTRADPEDKPNWKKIQTDTGVIWDKSEQLQWWSVKILSIQQDIISKRVEL